MPRSFSSSSQSAVTARADLRALTVPASAIAPPNSSSFSVSVVLPASGWEMIAKVRRRAISSVSGLRETIVVFLLDQMPAAVSARFTMSGSSMGTNREAE